MSDALDRAIITRVVKQVANECRVCHCHGDSCDLPEGGGEKCVLTGPLGTLCSSPPCQAVAMREKNSRRWAQKRARNGKRRAA